MFSVGSVEGETLLEKGLLIRDHMGLWLNSNMQLHNVKNTIQTRLTVDPYLPYPQKGSLGDGKEPGRNRSNSAPSHQFWTWDLLCTGKGLIVVCTLIEFVVSLFLNFGKCSKLGAYPSSNTVRR